MTRNLRSQSGKNAEESGVQQNGGAARVAQDGVPQDGVPQNDMPTLTPPPPPEVAPQNNFVQNGATPAIETSSRTPTDATLTDATTPSISTGTATGTGTCTGTGIAIDMSIMPQNSGTVHSVPFIPVPVAAPPHVAYMLPPPASRARSTASTRRLKALEMQERIAEMEHREAAARREKLRLMREQEEAFGSDNELDEEVPADPGAMARQIDTWWDHPPAQGAIEARPRTDAIELPTPRAAPPPPRVDTASAGPDKRALVVTDVDVLAQAMARANAEQMRLVQGLKPPKYICDLPVFSGRTDEWMLFKAAYDDSAHRFAPADNVARLQRALSGAAMEVASTLFTAHSGPAAIVQALETRFGHPDTLVIAHMQKIKELPRIARGTPQEICSFATKCLNVVSIVEQLNVPEYLQNPELVRDTIDKLPPDLKNAWYKFQRQRQVGPHGRIPGLKLLALFLEEEAADRAPYASIDYAHAEVPKKKSIRAAAAVATFAAGPAATIAAATSTPTSPATRGEKCPVCAKLHALPECPRFIEADNDARWEITKNNRICFRCLRSTHRRFHCRARPCGQNGCKMRHHKLLHDERRERRDAAPARETPPAESVVHATMSGVINTARTHRTAFLKVAQITLFGPKGSRDSFALLDEGSTVTIIDAELADAVGLEGPAETMTVQGVSGESTTHQGLIVTAQIKGKHQTSKHEITGRTFRGMNPFTQSVGERDVAGCNHLRDIQEQLIFEGTPGILIGQDNWALIVSREVRSGPRDQPVASRTELGWILHGCRTSTTYPIVFLAAMTQREEDLEAMMRRHFDLESLGVEPRRQASDPGKLALAQLEEKTRRLPDGRFETGLLWRQHSASPPPNYENTLKRLRNLERKLDRDPQLKEQYVERINNLLISGYAEPAAAPGEGPLWYLPHFAVINPAKKKIRVVHDAAAKTCGVSLNDMLLSGPDLLQALPAVVMKFRQHKIAVAADISEMFMQVKVAPRDRDALRFLWRGDRRDDAPPDEYRMTSIIFGATSSPCTALYVKNRNARENADEYPAAARAIEKNHYMDDYLHSFQSREEAIAVTSAVDCVHKKAGFELRGWASNDIEAIRHVSAAVSETTTESATVEIGGSDTEKTLGLLWRVSEDTLGFRANNKRVPQEVLDGKRAATKREALSLIMAVFDPLGLVSPVMTPAKRIMQDCWKFATGWDEPLPDSLQPRWEAWLRQLHALPNLRVPRCYEYDSAAERELHTFVDASEEAYVAAVYIRTTKHDGTVSVAIAAAKSRVAPTKPVSIPRLELQAALLGARLARTVVESHDFKFTKKTYWSDSRTALHWVRGEPRTYNAFVAHRLAEIEELSKKEEWRWVPTALNVADDSTRETPVDIGPQHRWFVGPPFLYRPSEEWPNEQRLAPTETGEERPVKCCPTTQAEPVIDIARFSRWNRLVRAMGRVLQFADLCRPRRATTAAMRRKRTKKTDNDDTDWRRPATKKAGVTTPRPSIAMPSASAGNYIVLDARYLYAAERALIILSQKQSFPQIPKNLPNAGGRLADLSVALDTEGVLRLRGRIGESDAIDYETANPAILDGDHSYTRLYIQHTHERLHHGGVELVVNALRQRHWIIRLRPTVKGVLKRCLPCRLRRAKPAQPSTGDLPAARLAHHARPFTFTGLDYFGPLEVTVGRRHEKRWVALFTCLTSRAIHLEVVASLSADSAICALRRMIARRGCPKEMWSDNATSFHAANRELAKALRALGVESASHRIAWRFLPPGAPFMAGAWERMVRSVKEALRVTLHERRPSDETLTTLLAEVEATVNSRPLTHVAVTPGSAPAITPNDILIGPNSHVPVPGNFEAADVDARAHWRRAQCLADVFWRRWVREYRPLLQHRREPHAKGVTPAVGDVVIVCDGNLPRNLWPRGRISAVYPGKDGEVRVVDVTTSNGHILRRATKKIVVLTRESPEDDGGRMCTTNLVFRSERPLI